MKLRTSEREGVFHPMDTRFFGTSYGRVRQRVLRTSVARVIWKEGSSDLPRSIVRFEQNLFGPDDDVFEKHRTRCLFGCAAQFRKGA